MKFLSHIALIISASLFFSQKAVACSCEDFSGPAILEAYESADFIGSFEVLSVENLKDHPEIISQLKHRDGESMMPPVENHLYKIKPVETLKGDLVEGAYAVSPNPISCTADDMQAGKIYKKIIYRRKELLFIANTSCKMLTDKVWTAFENMVKSSPKGSLK